MPMHYRVAFQRDLKFLHKLKDIIKDCEIKINITKQEKESKEHLISNKMC